jgi:glycosyltransferase involved in cell wall biosynthesis
MSSPTATASVIVPAYRRPAALMELVPRLLSQVDAKFEVIIVEQSDDDVLHERLRRTGDGRLRLVTAPARGLAAARNLGSRHATGDILVFIDDDDLPLGDRWLADHLANYADPRCMGVAGRWSSRDALDPPPRFPRLVRRLAFSYGVFKDPRTYAMGSLRKPNVEFITFSNASVRRELFTRVGGLDEGLEWGEEDTFAFKFARLRRDGEYLVFDPKPCMWRRLDVAGGLDRRHQPNWHINELVRRVTYYHTVTARYFPWRFRILYPLYVGRSLVKTEIWIWDPDNRHHSNFDRARASLDALARFPKVLWTHGLRAAAKATR